jgi:Flp pilus assembly protein TadD
MCLPFHAAPFRSASRMVAFAVAIGALSLGGCMRKESAEITGSINRQVQDMTDSEKRVAMEQLGRQYEKNPGDKRVSMTYARVLRDINQINQAIAVLQTTAVRYPNDREVAAALGKALADGGRFAEAMEVLSRAHTPDKPDWRVLSTQGAISDQTGKHTEAQQYYQAALQLQPDDPNILSNLGLSYALSNRLGEAEQVMRRAVANPASSPRVRGNLALVLALQGKFRESEEAASKDLSQTEAAANIAYVRSMTAQNNSWRQLQTMGGNTPARQAQRQATPIKVP